MKIQTIIKTLVLASLLCWAACQNNKDNAMVTVNQKGEITAFGQPVPDFETLKTVLMDSLANMATIPEKMDISFEGEVGMGTRQEVETIAAEAIEAAKLVKLAPTVEQQVFRKQQGKDCNKAEDDETRMDCAVIDLLYPAVTKGEKALVENVSAWVNSYLFAILENAEADTKSTSLDEAAKAFFKNHDDFKTEAEGSVMAGAFEARTGSEVVFNNGKYLTLAINGNTYMGGAHDSPTEALNTFDVKTGKLLTWDDLVTDKAEVQALAEKKVREVKADVFKEGFNFDEIFPFVLPANYGLTEEGLFLFYIPYEIMPYAMGETEVLIPFEELGPLSKINL
ncbi:MAG: DUF3298 domain-containing protein [Bacteroidetes bacterium]|nr:DUF3298 domain-containing protein [Bacteroidota bacterium]